MSSFEPELIVALTSLFGLVGAAAVGIYKFGQQKQEMVSALNHQRQEMVSAIEHQGEMNEQIVGKLKDIDDKLDETREHVAHIDGRLNGRHK